MTEAVTTKVGNAALNGMGKLIKLAEIQQKYGTTRDGKIAKELILCEASGEVVNGRNAAKIDVKAERIKVLQAEIEALASREG